MKKRYGVRGMSCAACVAHVEHAAQQVCGEGNVTVSLITNSLTVTADDNANEKELYEKLRRALKNAGYTLESDEKPTKSGNIADEELKKGIKRLIWSAVITAVLMVVAMGHMIGIPMPRLFTEHPYIFALVQLLLALPVVVINWRFFKNGFAALFRRSPNMDSLIAIGATASMIYGGVATVFMLVGELSANDALVHRYAHNLYFEGAAMILTLVTLGKTLEGRARANAASAVGKLAAMMPDEASVLREGRFVPIPISEIKVGDIVEIKSGETVAVDGVVIEGEGAMDESAISGESIPVEKALGDSVSAVCTLRGGYIKIRAEKIGADTTLSKIIALLEDAAASKAPISRIADKVSAIFVPVVIAISLLTAVVWIILSGDFARAFDSAVSVLVISCPCALGLATPTAIMVATARGASLGILIKSAEALENLCSAKIFLTDKTGTLTEGRPKVAHVIPISADECELFSVAYALESRSAHPLASAICEAAEERGGILKFEISDADFVVGKGIGAVISFEGDEKQCFIGSADFLAEKGVEITDESIQKIIELERRGATVAAVSSSGRLLGILGIADSVREDSKEAVAELKKMGIKTVMLTGDNEISARAVADVCGIDEVRARLLPEQKEAAIREYSREGRTIMAGDGINDAPALASADIGMAIGAGTEVAIDCASVVLSKNALTDAVSAISLSRATVSVIKENLFWALVYNAICIPIAAGALYPIWHISLSPMIASAAMSFSSVCVVLNSIRLRYKKIYRYDKKENDEMFGKTKTVSFGVEGMMCNNCKAHVEKAILSVKGVKSVEAVLDTKTVTVTAKESVSEDALKSAVIAAGYKVV